MQVKPRKLRDNWPLPITQGEAMYKRILVAVDGSGTANRGLKEALRLAKAHQARICLLHVVEEFFITQAGEAAMYAEQMFKTLRAEGRRILSRAQALARRQGLSARPGASSRCRWRWCEIQRRRSAASSPSLEPSTSPPCATVAR